MQRHFQLGWRRHHPLGLVPVKVGLAFDTELAGVDWPLMPRSMGYYSIILDNGPKQYLNGYRPVNAQIVPAVTFASHGLPQGSHTIVLTNEQNYDPSGSPNPQVRYCRCRIDPHQ